MKSAFMPALVLLLPLLASGCSDSNMQPMSQEVTATAYTLSESETKKGNVGLAAWGDQLEPGMKAVAVSRDLIKKGLTHNTEVTIEGLGDYIVLDKMNRRWKDKIDILMESRDDAREWGKRTVTIHWKVSREEGNTGS